jgi:three-Cys-motif partner protein
MQKTVRQQFGGSWTETKLEALEKYLKAYLQIFHNNERAKSYSTIYVDAFAGTGYMEKRKRKVGTGDSFPELVLPEIDELAKGSARRALEVQPGFNHYLFIEKSQIRCKQLQAVKDEHPNIASNIQIENADANAFLSAWCKSEDWSRHRALVFLDPFGMQVDWELLKSIANTGAVDLWLLFPLGIGVTRLLTKNGRPPQRWADNLTRVLGADDWMQFYKTEKRPTLFDEEQIDYRDVDFSQLSTYFVGRLKEIFPDVATNPKPLYNSRNSPMYLLCFATANPQQARSGTAVKIAEDVLRKLR